MYALIVFDPRATAPAVFSALRVSAARRDVVAVGLLWQQQPLDVLLLRQVVVVLPPRVQAGAGDELLSVHQGDDGGGGGGVDVLRCSPLLCLPFRSRRYYACSMRRMLTLTWMWKKTSGSALMPIVVVAV